MTDVARGTAGPSPDPASGVFETMLVIDGEPLELELHLDRLRASVATLYDRALSVDEASAAIRGASRGHRCGRVRLTVLPKDGALALKTSSADVDPALVLPSVENAAELAVAVVDPVGPHKWADRDLLASLEAAASPAVPLLVTAEGMVLEASRGNVVVVRDGALDTPPADGAILPGVTRAIVLELARSQGVAAREVPVALDELRAADEVFLTGAIRGVEPVTACEDATWPVGPVTRMLAAALSARWSIAR